MSLATIRKAIDGVLIARAELRALKKPWQEWPATDSVTAASLSLQCALDSLKHAEAILEKEQGDAHS